MEGGSIREAKQAQSQSKQVRKRVEKPSAGNLYLKHTLGLEVQRVHSGKNDHEHKTAVAADRDEYVKNLWEVEIYEFNFNQPVESYQAFACQLPVRVNASSSKNLEVGHRELTGKQESTDLATLSGNIDLAFNKPSSENVSNSAVVCNFCGRQVSNLQKHTHKHHKDSSGRRWICTHCPKTYAFAQKLKEHYEAVHGPNCYKCRVCYKVFRNPRCARQHETKLCTARRNKKVTK